MIRGFLAQTLTGMPMSTTSLSAAHATTLNPRRLHRMTLCVSGPRIFASGCEYSPSTAPNVWTTRSLLGWFPSFTLQRIAKNAAPTFHSTTNQELGGETWRAPSVRGLGSREGGAQKIRALDFGATLWMTNSPTGTGPSSLDSVCISLSIHETKD